MIFGEIVTEKNYCDFYPELLYFVQHHYENVESGIQGDAYIWIKDKNEKVALDTFTSMRFQIKSSQRGGTLLEGVINLLESSFSLYIYDEPED